MDFFGLTTFGASDPIKFLIRPDYKEPDAPSNLVEKIQKGDYNRPLAEVVRDVDVYSGILDGYSYKSYHRLRITRDRGFKKPVGPKDIYRDSITGAMQYGAFLDDPELKGKTWFHKEVFLPIPSSESTRFVNDGLMKDKTFIL